LSGCFIGVLVLKKKEEGRRKKEEGRGKKEEGRGKRKDAKLITDYRLLITNNKI
jgi:hypothetical protein